MKIVVCALLVLISLFAFTSARFADVVRGRPGRVGKVLPETFLTEEQYKLAVLAENKRLQPYRGPICKMFCLPVVCETGLDVVYLKYGPLCCAGNTKVCVNKTVAQKILSDAKNLEEQKSAALFDF
jgi:hypothetical protein